MRALICLTFCLLLISAALLAQQEESDADGADAEVSGLDDYLSILHELQDNPLDINRASRDRLLEIPFLDRRLAAEIIRRRGKNPFEKLEELLQLPGMSAELLEAIRPYLKVRRSGQQSGAMLDLRLSQPLQPSRGRREGQYASLTSLRQRYFWDHHSGLRAGILWEKDSGERSLTDLASFYLSLPLPEVNALLHIGDYDLQAGYGLVAAGAYGSRLVAGGSASPLSPSLLRWRVKRNGDEHAYARGGLVELLPQNGLKLLLAFSRRALDGQPGEDSLSISSIDRSGNHRTENERLKQNRLRESRYLAGVVLGGNAFQLAGVAARQSFSLPLDLEQGVVQRIADYSLSFSLGNKLLRLGGENAWSGNHPATMLSLVIQQPGISWAVAAFRIHPRFPAQHGRLFGSFSSLPVNRRGALALINLRLWEGGLFGLRLQADSPVRDVRGFIQLKRATNLYLKHTAGKNQFECWLTHRSSAAEALRVDSLEVRNAARIRWALQANRRLRVRQQVELSWLNSPLPHSGAGISLFQELQYQLNSGSGLQVRWSQFHVSDFAMRQYEVESDLPGQIRSVLLNDRGYKWFLLLRFQRGKHLLLAAKYRMEFYPDRETIGSGLDEIEGGRRRAVSFYLRLSR